MKPKFKPGQLVVRKRRHSTHLWTGVGHLGFGRAVITHDDDIFVVINESEVTLFTERIHVVSVLSVYGIIYGVARELCALSRARRR